MNVEEKFISGRESPIKNKKGIEKNGKRRLTLLTILTFE